MAIEILRSSQGYFCRRLTLAQNQSYTVLFDKEPVSFDSGGFSWQLFPSSSDATDIEVAVEHSLSLEGDYWTPAPFSPYDEPREGSESFRINRVRFTNTGPHEASVLLLSSSICSIEPSA